MTSRPQRLALALLLVLQVLLAAARGQHVLVWNVCDEHAEASLANCPCDEHEGSSIEGAADHGADPWCEHPECGCAHLHLDDDASRVGDVATRLVVVIEAVIESTVATAPPRIPIQPCVGANSKQRPPEPTADLRVVERLARSSVVLRI